MSDIIEQGSVVTFHYALTIISKDKLADDTRGDEPAIITIGAGDMIEGLERRLLGLKKGDKKSFEVPCMEAYGPAEQERVHTMQVSDFPESMKVEPGLVVGFETPGGDELAGVIERVEGDEVIVDFSHPLAGYDLLFEVEIIDVQ